jgi:hypothetical protein
VQRHVFAPPLFFAARLRVNLANCPASAAVFSPPQWLQRGTASRSPAAAAAGAPACGPDGGASAFAITSG